MIFKKNSDWSSSSSKNYNVQQKPVQQQRREPEVSRTTQMSNTMNTPSSPYPSPSLNASTPAPTSPVASAQARRPQNSPANTYARQDQLRKLTVGRDISLNGEITTCDHLVVEGTVKATIKGGKILEISETGAFDGVVDIQDADIAGEFKGNLTVRGKLIVRSTANVTGKIHYARLQVDTGASINGEMNVINIKAAQPSPSATTFRSESEETHVPQSATSNDDDQTRLFSFTSINDEPGFLKASA